MQLDKFNKRIRQLEGELSREQDMVKERDDRIASLGRDISAQQREMERYQTET